MKPEGRICLSFSPAHSHIGASGGSCIMGAVGRCGGLALTNRSFHGGRGTFSTESGRQRAT